MINICTELKEPQDGDLWRSRKSWKEETSALKSKRTKKKMDESVGAKSCNIPSRIWNREIYATEKHEAVYKMLDWDPNKWGQFYREELTANSWTGFGRFWINESGPV
jgi:hypothetical protein